MFAFVLLVVLTVCGAVWTYAFDRQSSLVFRLACGVAMSFALFSQLALLLACLMQLNAASIGLATLILLVPTFLLWRRKGYGPLLAEDWGAFLASWGRPGAWLLRLVYLGLFAFLYAVFARAMYIKPEGLYTGYSATNFGDLPLHIQIIDSFALGQNFPPENPIFAGVPFSYPFLSDFLSGVLVACGLDVRGAMIWPSLLLTISTVILLWQLALEMVRDRTAASIAPFLLLFSGGLGWWAMVNDASSSETGVLGVLPNLPQTYTMRMNDTVWKWGNVISTLLVTQRSIVMGLPLTLVIFVLWWRAAQRTSRRVEVVDAEEVAEVAEDPAPVEGTTGDRAIIQRQLLVAGALAGLLPLIHTHAFLVVMFVGLCLSVLFWKPLEWLKFAGVALVLAVPQLFWLLRSGSNNRTTSFFGWLGGWKGGWETQIQVNWLKFWLLNTGLFVPLLIVGWVLLARARRENGALWTAQWKFYLAFFGVCFVAPNLFRMAPWPWDNIKVLIFWWLLSTPIVALAVAQLWRGEWGQMPRLQAHALAAFCLLVLTLAGFLDAWRGLTSNSQPGTANPEAQVYNRQQMDVADWLKANTSGRSLFLNAPIQNSPVFLTGRRSMMGYTGHVSSHGVDFAEREQDISRFLSQDPGYESIVDKYKIDYFIIGPQEADYLRNRSSGTGLNQAEFSKRWNKVVSFGEYTVYKTR